MADNEKQLKDAPEYGDPNLKRTVHNINVSQSALRFLRRFGRKGDSWADALDNLVTIAKANKLRLPDPEDEED